MKIVSSHLSATTVTRNCCWVNWNAFLMILELCSILAQTCECLELYDEAYDYYKKREAIRENGAMPEETYHSLYRLGNLCIRLKKSHEETVKSYTDALEFWNRVEPMLRLCEYYLFVRQQPRHCTRLRNYGSVCTTSG